MNGLQHLTKPGRVAPIEINGEIVLTLPIETLRAAFPGRKLVQVDWWRHKAVAGFNPA